MTGNSTGDSTQYLVMTYMGKESEKGAIDIDMCIYIWCITDSLCCTHKTL